MITYENYWIRLPHHTDMTTEGYFGYTKNFKQRMNSHRKKSSGCLHVKAAINKHGWDNLIVERVYSGSKTECQLYEKLMRPTSDIGWNIQEGGLDNPINKKEKHPNFGKTLSKEQREKISKANSGENHPMWGKTHSQETRDKISKASRGENNPNFGKTPSKEYREKISKANKGKIRSEEARKNLSKAKSGMKHPRARPANVYCYKTDELIAEKVVLNVWCREAGHDSRSLSKTARADRSLPSTKSNRHQHKGIYARYLDDDE